MIFLRVFEGFCIVARFASISTVLLDVGPSWRHLGAFRGDLEALLGLVRAILELSWAILGLSWAILGPRLAIFGHLGDTSSSFEALNL